MGYEQLSCEVREERPLTTKIGNGKPCFSFARQCCHLGARLQTTTCCFDPAKKLTRTIMSGVNPLLLLTDSCISRVRTNTTMNGVTKMALKVKKLSEHAFIPTRGSPFSAGYDLYSAYDCVVPARGKQLVKTDIAIAVPMDHYGRVAPRSGLAWKNSIDVGAGVIDYDYRGNVGVILFNHSDDEFKVSKGDRVAQLVLERISTPDVIEVNELDETQRSDGGFGSTGVSL